MTALDSFLSQRHPIYTRGNVSEVFPEPVSPLMADCGIPEAEAGWRDAWFRIGAFEPDEFAPDDLEQLAIVGGYCFLNASLIRLFGERAPGLGWQDMDEQFLGAQPGIPPYSPEPGDVRPDLTDRIAASFHWAVTVEDVPEVDHDRLVTERLRAERPDLRAADDRDLVDRFLELVAGAAHFRHLFEQHLFSSFMAAVPVGIVRSACAAVGRPAAILELLGALGNVDSARPAFALWALSRLPADSPDAASGVDEFIAEFGFRGPNEWDLRSPTWESHPELVHAAVDALRALPDGADPRRRADLIGARRQESARALLDALSGDEAARQQVAAALVAAAGWVVRRERTKANAVRLVHEARMAMRELGRRMVERRYFDEVEDYCLLRQAELDAFVTDAAAFKGVIERRRHEHADRLALAPPFTFVGSPPPLEAWARRSDAAAAGPVARGTVLTGVAGSPGVAEGPARVVHGAAAIAAAEPGDVIICPLTDVSWTPSFIGAAAVVADVGALLSHGVIVCRELGTPCVVSVTSASDRIANAAPVRVDGSQGTVTLL